MNSQRTQRYVAGFAFDETRNTVALVKKKTPDWQRGFFNGIGGKVEPGESPAEAMVREFHEETGVFTECSEWEHSVTLIGPSWEVVFFRSFTSNVMAVRTMETEEIHLVSVDQMMKGEIPVVPNLRWLVALMLDKQVLPVVTVRSL